MIKKEEIQIPSDITEYFISKNIEASLLIFRVINDSSNPISTSINNLFNTIKDSSDNPLEYISKIIEKEIVRRRKNYLCKDFYEEIPLPYNHQDLTNIQFDKNYLINMADLKNSNIKTTFQILPSLPQLNSMYWCKQHLVSLKENAEVRIRLDPFMYAPIGTAYDVMYKMLVYGKNLDWEELADLKEEVHLRWAPDEQIGSDIVFTDLVWSPRSDGIHFICEEVPEKKFIESRGSRYFHGIYHPEKLCFSHFDGAIRFYDYSEILERKNSHVRKIGKLGKRVKIFQVDGLVKKETWCNIIVSFFIWNQDIDDYFNN